MVLRRQVCDKAHVGGGKVHSMAAVAGTIGGEEGKGELRAWGSDPRAFSFGCMFAIALHCPRCCRASAQKGEMRRLPCSCPVDGLHTRRVSA